MAEHHWPSSLPPFLVDGYSRGGGDDGVLRSQMDGAVRSRPKTSAPPREPVTGRLNCAPAQLQTLMDFWELTLGRVLPFNYVDHTKGESAAVYAFTGRPSYQPTRSGMRWLVTLPLEIVSTTPGAFGLGLLDEDDEELTT